MPQTIFPNGRGDDLFIADVRRTLDDKPRWISQNTGTDGSQGVIAPGSKPFVLDKPPIIRGSVLLTAPSGPWSIVYDVAPTAGQVAIFTDTGEIVFASVPVAGNLSVIYQTSRFGDNQILSALREGLNALYPEIWQPAMTTAFVLDAVNFEYGLPQPLYDPRAVIMKVEVMYPTGFVRWFEVRDWERVSADTIKFGSLRFPAAQVRITYNANYNALGDVEPNCMHLPVYYAVSRILADSETKRTRQSELVPMTGEGASAPGTASRLADYWMQRFETEKRRFARPLPFRGTVALPTQ